MELDKQNPQYKPRILKQGLIMSLLPISIGSFFLLLLLQLCINAEHLSKIEKEQGQILVHCNYAVNYWSQSCGNLLGRGFSDDKKFEADSQEFVDLMNSEFESLLKICKSKSSKKTARVFKTLCQESIATLLSIPQATGSDSISSLNNLNKMPAVFAKLYAIPTKLDKLLEQEWQALNKYRLRADQQASVINRIVLLSFAGNILIALLLVWSFSKNISTRLRIVARNASLLPKLEEAKEKVDGNDEIAYLADAIENASRKLIMASEHRRSIFGMVAHDMRSPLNASMLCVDVVEERFGSQCGAESSALLSSARAKLSGILKDVNAILKIEQEKQEKQEIQEIQEEQDSKGKLATTGPAPDNSDHQQVKPDKAELGKEAHEKADSDTLVPGKSESRSKQARSIYWLNPIRLLSEMLLAPKIMRKGIWLILIPFIVQSVLLVMLNKQLAENSKLVKAERQQSKILITINSIFLQSMKASVSEAIYFVSVDPQAREKMEENFRQVVAQLNKVEKENILDNDWLSLMKSWRKMVRLHIKQANQDTASGRQTDIGSLTERVKAYKPLKAKAVKIRNRITAKFMSESKNIEKLEDGLLKSRLHLQQILLFGIAANLLIAICLLFAFNKDITKRLKMLVDNAKVMGESSKLHNMVGGKDELSYLDLMLHHAQEELLKASRERVELMNSIANNMERPLAEAKFFLKKFREMEKSNLQEKLTKQLDRAMNNIDRVLVLIGDLQCLETMEIGKVNLETSTCDMQSVAEESIAIVSSLAKAKDLELLNEVESINVEADRSRLIQTIVNFLSNAIKFSPEKTCIRVCSDLNRDSLRLSVVDQGMGMNPETKARVFEKFFQAESAEKKQGFGLGLAICNLIVDSHGGQLGVESEEGKGSSFWFELPLTQEPKQKTSR